MVSDLAWNVPNTTDRTMESDKDLWRQNGLYTSSESESGKSDFDEDYYNLRPPYNPDEYRNSNIITIHCNQFSADGRNKLNIPVTTACQSEAVLDQNLKVNNTKQSNVVQSKTKKKKKKKKKKKTKSTTDEHQIVNSVTSNNVTDIRSNCKPYSEDDCFRRIMNLMLNDNFYVTHEENLSEASLREVYANDSLHAYSEENIDRNFNNENNIIAIRNITDEASESNDSIDYYQYRDSLVYESATYYLNREKEYLSNMSCLRELSNYEASKLNINIEHPPMPKKEITKKLQSRQQINLTNTIENKNVIVEAIIEVIVFGLRPFETIFQELWNEFF